MNVYVAAQFDLWREADKLAKACQRAGHEITSTWIAYARSVAGKRGDATLAAKTCLDAAKACELDVTKADAVIAIVGSRGTGMWFELGLARGQGKPIIVVPVSAGVSPHPHHDPAGYVLGRSIFCRLARFAPTYDEAARML